MLQLPDLCLREILRQCAADDQRSLFNAARAHSRLYIAAADSLSSIRTNLNSQQQLDSSIRYLSRYRKHVHSFEAHTIAVEAPIVRRRRPSAAQSVQKQQSRGERRHHKLLAVFSKCCLSLCGLHPAVHEQQDKPTPTAAVQEEEEPVEGCPFLYYLPARWCQLQHLILSNVQMQVAPGGRRLGALRAGVPLKQLSLEHCTILDGTAGLSTALPLLTQLQHISINGLWASAGGRQDCVGFPVAALQNLQQLTCLKLLYCNVATAGAEALVLPASLCELRLTLWSDWKLSVSMLAHMQQLTCLDAWAPHSPHGSVQVESAALAGMPQLRYLRLRSCDLLPTHISAAEFLTHLKDLTKLTHVQVDNIANIA